MAGSMIVYRNRVYFSGRFEIGCCFTGPAGKKQFLIPEQAVNGGITENNLSKITPAFWSGVRGSGSLNV
jgi:hypothetical protein